MWAWFKKIFCKKETPVSAQPPGTVVVVPPSTPAPEVPTVEEVEKFPEIKPGAHGLDLSHHNLKVGFPKLKSQGFVILKASEALGVDKTFDSRFLGLKLMGITRGAYHFYRCNRDWKMQADHFIKTLGPLDGSEILALDYETCEIKGLIQTLEQLRESKPDALKFLAYVKEKTGITPWLYTYHNVIQSIDFEEEFAKYPLWYARYTSVRPKDAQGPWKKWTAWQYSDKGVVDGVSNDVDMNWYNS